MAKRNEESLHSYLMPWGIPGPIWFLNCSKSYFSGRNTLPSQRKVTLEITIEPVFNYITVVSLTQMRWWKLWINTLDFYLPRTAESRQNGDILLGDALEHQTHNSECVRCGMDWSLRTAMTERWSTVRSVFLTHAVHVCGYNSCGPIGRYVSRRIPAAQA